VLLTFLIRQLPFSSAPPMDRAAVEHSARVERIAREHLDAIWRTARRLGVLDGDVDDVAQEVLMVVLRRLADIEADRERAFVIATTARVTCNYRRGRRRRAEDLIEWADEVGPDDAAALEHMRVASQEQSVERAQKLALLQAALSEMTEAQRVAFTMFELEQLTAREIAAELDMPEAAVVSRVRRAREVFKRCCARFRIRTKVANSAASGGER
jgi:RNA polymerase sigma-70 factor, ECF subfamily